MEKATKSKEFDETPSPNTISYNTILHNWSKSDMDIALGRAGKVLNYMVKSGRQEIAPDAISFSCVMEVWAKSKEPQKAAKIRKMLYFANLVPKGDVRIRMALQVFDTCCEGMMGNLVCNEIRSAVPSQVLDRTYWLKKRCGDMELRDLPRSWNRFDKNAPTSKRSEKTQTSTRSPRTVSIIETA